MRNCYGPLTHRDIGCLSYCNQKDLAMLSALRKSSTFQHPAVGDLEFQAPRLDSYLEIAAAILRTERRPLSPRAILAAAYRADIVPHHLHGKSQHKTLQARISEDIVARKEQSLFFRPMPGQFFLREFLTDTTLPEEFRRPFPARRRIRELLKGPALCVDRQVLQGVAKKYLPVQPRIIFNLVSEDRYAYRDPAASDHDCVFIRTFVCFCRSSEVLTYRQGRYRESRDTFMQKRSIGFSTFVEIQENTLFSRGDLGITDAGIRAVNIDLDIPEAPLPGIINAATLSYFAWVGDGSGADDLLAVVRMDCPPWFEPTKRRLALNDLAWLDTTKPINNIDDFDPWSKFILCTYYQAMAGTREKEADYPDFLRSEFG